MSKEIENLLAEAAELYKKEECTAAIEKYEAVLAIDKKHVEAQFMVAEIHHQLGDLPAALSAYYLTTDLQPDHKKANVKIEMIKSILDFFNPDLYNP